MEDIINTLFERELLTKYQAKSSTTLIFESANRNCGAAIGGQLAQFEE